MTPAEIAQHHEWRREARQHRVLVAAVVVVMAVVVAIQACVVRARLAAMSSHRATLNR